MPLKQENRHKLESSERLDPLSDVVFNKMFEDMESAVALKEIINAILTDAGDEPIDAITDIKSQYVYIGKQIGSKGGRLDVKARAASGELFDIEVQLKSTLYMNDRSWFYGSHMMSEEFEAGDDFDSIPQVRVINILDFIMRKEHADFLQPIGILYRKNPPLEVASDSFRIYNIELPKFRERYKTLDDVRNNVLLMWLYLFEVGYKNEQELEVLETMTEGMRDFAERYKLAMNDPDLRGLYELDLSARRDHNTMINAAKREGRLEMGHDAIKALMSNNVPLEIIYKSFPLEKAEIDSVIAQCSRSS